MTLSACGKSSTYVTLYTTAGLDDLSLSLPFVSWVDDKCPSLIDICLKPKHLDIRYDSPFIGHPRLPFIIVAVSVAHKTANVNGFLHIIHKTTGA